MKIKEIIKLFLYLVCITSFLASLCLIIGILVFFPKGVFSLHTFLEDLYNYVVNETTLFEWKITAPKGSEKDVTFLMLFYFYHIYYALNVLPIFLYPYLALYNIWFFTCSYTPIGSIIFQGAFCTYNYVPSIVFISKLSLFIWKTLLYLPIQAGILISFVFSKLCDWELVSGVLTDPKWVLSLPSDIYSLMRDTVFHPVVNGTSHAILNAVEVTFSPLIFFFNLLTQDCIFGVFFAYPAGLLFIVFSSIGVFSTIVDFINHKSKSDSLAVAEVNRWYKNSMILRVLFIYNFLFLLYLFSNTVLNNFSTHKTWKYSEISNFTHLIFDTYSIISLMFFMLFFLVFIRIAFFDLKKLIDLNTIILLIISMLVLIFLVQLSDIFLVYLGIVCLSLCLYPLIALDKKSTGNNEAVSKYFFLGALGSAVMLYGITLLYKEVNTLSYEEIKNLDFSALHHDGATFGVIVGLLFIIFGFFFKLSIIPLQNWTPDVYLGSPTVITCFLATIVKFGIFSTFFRTYYSVLINFFHNNQSFKHLLIAIAVGSILIGAFGAIDQFKIKRFLGFTTINQMGFILLGISLQNLFGFVASYVYLCIYVMLNLIFFSFILNIKLENGRELIYLSDLVPFFKNNKIAAMFFILLLFSLAGMPPTIGFYMKVLLLKSLVISGYVKLTVVVLYVNVFSILYYIRIIKIIFFDAENLIFFDRASADGSSKSSLKKSLFVFFKKPFDKIKGIGDINNKSFLRLLIYSLRQFIFYGLILFFLSGVWYNTLADNITTSKILAHIWSDLNLADSKDSLKGGLEYSVRAFLKAL